MEKPNKFLISDLINFLPPGRVFVLLSIFTENFSNIIDLNEGKYKLFISIKDQNKVDKDSAILNINKPIINIESVFINSIFVRCFRYQNYFLSTVKVPNANIYGIYLFRNLILLLKGDKDHKIQYNHTHTTFNGTKLALSPNEYNAYDQKKGYYFTSDSIEKLSINSGLEFFDESSNFPNIKKVKMQILSFKKNKFPISRSRKINFA